MIWTANFQKIFAVQAPNKKNLKIYLDTIKLFHNFAQQKKYIMEQSLISLYDISISVLSETETEIEISFNKFFICLRFETETNKIFYDLYDENKTHLDEIWTEFVDFSDPEIENDQNFSNLIVYILANHL